MSISFNYPIELKFMKYPLYNNDFIAAEPLNKIQIAARERFLSKIQSGTYHLQKNECICQNKTGNNLVISEKDRYGIPVKQILCSNCGIIYSEEILDEGSLKKFYDEDYRELYVGCEIPSESFFFDQVKRGEQFVKLLKKINVLNEINDVYEIGSGAGGLLFPFQKLDKKVKGCDYGSAYLSFGRKMGLELIHGGLKESNIPDESQDLIILIHVLEHLVNPYQELLTIIRKIKKGKYLLLEVPGIFCIHSIYLDPILYFQNAHIYNFSKLHLVTLCKKLGLSVIYGNERATILLQKPYDWEEKKIGSSLIDFNTKQSKFIKRYLSSVFWLNKIHFNPYYFINRLMPKVQNLKIMLRKK